MITLPFTTTEFWMLIVFCLMLILMSIKEAYSVGKNAGKNRMLDNFRRHAFHNSAIGKAVEYEENGTQGITDRETA